MPNSTGRMTWGEMIRKAITEQNTQLAEAIAARMQFRWKMTYTESADFIKRHAPEVDPEEFFQLADNNANRNY